MPLLTNDSKSVAETTANPLFVYRNFITFTFLVSSGLVGSYKKDDGHTVIQYTALFSLAVGGTGYRAMQRPMFQL